MKNKTFHKRKILVVFAGAFAMIFVLIGRLTYLMVFDAEYYQKKAEDLFQDFLHSENLQLVYADLLSDWQIEEDLDYIIHGASATDSSFFVEHPVETIDLAINGTKKMLELAKNKQVRSMVYLSSLEVYGTTNPDASSINEKDYGIWIQPVSAAVIRKASAWQSPCVWVIVISIRCRLECLVCHKLLAQV